MIDDLIIYFLREDWFRLVVNAGTTDKDLAWMQRHAPAFGVRCTHRTDLGILAVQGPQTRDKVLKLLPEALARRRIARSKPSRRSAWIRPSRGSSAATGYTGEDGFELILPHAELVSLWQQLARRWRQALRPRRARHAAS